jgi:thiamine biosynthesis lipoprotein
LIERSIRIGDLTQGAFDITFQGLGDLWRFDGSQTVPPVDDSIKARLEKIGYKKIQLLDSSKVLLPEKGMAIGFGGIGQGYAVDKVKALLLSRGIQDFVVNSSGDVFAHGQRADGSPWKVGVADPEDKEFIIRWLEVDGKAVVTSGNYEKYFEHDGIRYAHIIDPKTGWPTQGILSVTVISPNTEVADALATALFVLGKDVGIDLVNQLPDTHCIIIDDKKHVSYSRKLTAN